MHPVAEVQALINTLKRVNMSESMDVDSFHFEKKVRDTGLILSLQGYDGKLDRGCGCLQDACPKFWLLNVMPKQQVI